MLKGKPKENLLTYMQKQSSWYCYFVFGFIFIIIIIIAKVYFLQVFSYVKQAQVAINDNVSYFGLS